MSIKPPKNHLKYRIAAFCFLLLIFLSSSSFAVDPTAFVSTWNTANISSDSSLSNQIKLPLVSSGTYNFTVAWGDGSSETITAYNQPGVTHTYATGGDKTISITGTIEGFEFDGNGDKLKIKNINSWGILRVGNGAHYFLNCANLNSTATDNLDLAGTTDLTSMFAGADAFNGDISGWDTIGVTNMRYMFYGADAFNQNISSWDTRNVTNMFDMFGYDPAFNQPIGSWNVSSVSDMSRMFEYATSFNQNIGSWNVSSVESMTLMFDGTALSTTNYSNLLTGWSAQALHSGVTFSGGNSKYNAGALSARNTMTGGPNNWTITDGGIQTWTITPTAGANGTISPSTATTTNDASSTTFTFTPNTGYGISQVLVDGVATTAATSYTFTNVTANHTIEADFAINTYVITSEAGSNGTIEPLGIVSKDYGTSQTYTIIPNTNYIVSDVLVDGSSEGAVSTYTFSNISSNHTIEALFEIDSTNNLLINGDAQTGDFTGWFGTSYGGNVWVNSDIGGGNRAFISSAIPKGSTPATTTQYCNMYQIINLVAKGYSPTYLDSAPRVDISASIYPGTIPSWYRVTVELWDAHHNRIASIAPYDTGKSSLEAHTIPSNIFTGYGSGLRYIYFWQGGHSNTMSSKNGAKFDKSVVLITAPAVFTVEASSGSNGSISPSGSIIKSEGFDVALQISAEAGYKIGFLTVDGGITTEGAGTANYTYTFSNISANHSIEATFAINTFTITSEAGNQGTIFPSGETSVNYGSNQQYLITPEAGYSVSGLSVDAVTVTATTEYTFTNVTANHSIEATFVSSAIPVNSPEADVVSGVTTTVVKANWKANGNPAAAEYYCENITAGTNSGWITALTWTSASLEASTMYNFRVKARITATAESGWTALGTQETTAQTTADASVAGVNLENGDTISGTLTITVSLTRETTVSSLSIKPLATLGGVKSVQVDGVDVAYDLISTTDTSVTLKLRDALSVGTHTVKIITYDTAGTEYVLERTGLIVASGVVTTTGPTLVYPNPYNPLAGNLKITYYLSGDKDISIYVIDTSGRLVWKSNYLSGANGGKAGYNEILWDGVGIFGALASDAYIVNVIEQGTGRLITKTKLLIWKGGAAAKKQSGNIDFALISLLALLGLTIGGASFGMYDVVRKIKK